MKKIIDIRVNEGQALFLSNAFYLAAFLVRGDIVGLMEAMQNIRLMANDGTVSKEDLTELNAIFKRLAKGMIE